MLGQFHSVEIQARVPWHGRGRWTIPSPDHYVRTLLSALNLRIETKTCVQWRNCACAFSVAPNSRTVAGSMAPLDVCPSLERPEPPSDHQAQSAAWLLAAPAQHAAMPVLARDPSHPRASPNLASLNRPAGNL